MVNTSVAAVVMTYNRRERLRRWLDAIRQQTHLPAETIIVDNGSADGSVEMVAGEFPDATLLVLKNNQGPSAAAAAGMRHAFEKQHDWVWIFDDDAFPERTALETALTVAGQVGDSRLGGVWLPFDDFGGWLWRSRKIPVSVAAMSVNHARPFRVDQVDLNMTLLSRRAIQDVGYPRADFFIMLWSCEYCLRLADAGYAIWVAPSILVRHEHAGSTDSGVWRSYYQTRNHLALGLQRRSPAIIFWWFLRQCRFVAGTLLRHDRKWERLGLRLRGACDALAARMGKRVDPGDYPETA